MRISDWSSDVCSSDLPIDVSAWPSLWMMTREKETGYRASMRHALIDFHIGYVGTVVLAIFFLALGALVMFGTGETFGVTGAQFSRDFIRMYGSRRSEAKTSELQSLMRISYAVFYL